MASLAGLVKYMVTLISTTSVKLLIPFSSNFCNEIKTSVVILYVFNLGYKCKLRNLICCRVHHAPVQTLRVDNLIIGHLLVVGLSSLFHDL